jgi:hypothetical protein
MKGYVTALGVLHVLSSCFAALIGFITLFASGVVGVVFSRAIGATGLSPDFSSQLRFPEMVFALIASSVLLFSLVTFIIAIGLLQLRQWARGFGIAVSIFYLLLIPCGTILGIFGLSVLLPKATHRLFTPIGDTEGQRS